MLLQAIVAIKIEISQFVVKCKLRQIKDNRDLLGVGHPLKASAKNAIGEAMFAAAAVKA